MAIRILLLTQWFDPEPTPKGLNFARELVRQGFDVEVVTGFPNYPGGKTYSGYRVKLLQRESSGNVKVTRVPLYPSHSQSAIGRVINYVTFAGSALIYTLFFARRPDVIYAYHPPLTVGMVAALVRTLRRVPVVYDIQDMWPDTLRATGMVSNGTALRIVTAVCNWVYRHVDHVVVLSPGFKRLLKERRVREDKIDVIYNWSHEAASAQGRNDADERSPDEKFRVVFAGNMGKAQALDAVLAAAKILQGRAPNVTFTFVGQGIETAHLKEIVREQDLRNVQFIAQVPFDQMDAILKRADALLVHLRRDPLFEITIPSKTQAYLASGRPVLMAVHGDAAALIEESGAGVLATPEDPESIASAVLSLVAAGPQARARMGAAACEFYRQKLSLNVGVSRFAAIFRRLAGPDRASG